MSTVYAGNCTTATDQAGKARKSCSDALGRLVQVFEPDASTSLVYETDYQYDVLNNLLRVDQKGNTTDSTKWRTRLFTYNSLSQLTQASNPESGTTTYSYDNDGNVQTKLDARGITTSYSGYDGMHRLLGKTYSNGDPAIAYTYDQTNCLGQNSCANVGRRTGMTDGAGSEAWSYDIMGRPLADQRTTGGVTKSSVSTHTTGGFVSQLTYPSTRTVTYSFDAAGRAVSAADTTNSINYVSFALYSPAGPLSSMQNGPSLASTYFYNNRVQTCRISVRGSGTAPGSCVSLTSVGNLLDLTYNFGIGMNDNGDVLGITNNIDGTRSQNFTYDPTNRLSSAQTTSTFSTSPAHCWGEIYTYDQVGGGAWGNLITIGVVSSAYNGCVQEGLNVSATSVNQISATGMSYDLSGNMLSDGVRSYGWNAESRLNSAVGVNYTTDGDGKRVEKSTGKVYWFGSDGNVLDETDPSGSTNNSSFNEYIYFNGQRIARRDSLNNAYYNIDDHLGTARVVAEIPSGGNSATLCYDADFYPFGGERTYTATCSQSYKFTGKERDSESGLDNFGARYNSSQYGRFMSPDPLGGHLTDPQTLNKYAYVRNNPVSFTDPTGLDLQEVCTDKGPDCGKSHWWNQERHVGTTDADGHFHVTHFQSDQNGDFQGHNVNLDSNGIHIDGNRGEFIPGTPATRVNGASGSAFDGMHGVFNSNCGGTCAAGGALFGTNAQFQSLLHNLVGPNPGLDAIDPFHPNTVQYRGGNTNGPDAHLSYQGSEDPNQQDPFHFDNRYPYGSVGGFLEHTGGVIQTLWNSVSGKQGEPLPQDIPGAGVPH